MPITPKPVYLAGRRIGSARTTVEAAAAATASGVPIDPHRPGASVARLIEDREGFYIDMKDRSS